MRLTEQEDRMLFEKDPVEWARQRIENFLEEESIITGDEMTLSSSSFSLLDKKVRELDAYLNTRRVRLLELKEEFLVVEEVKTGEKKEVPFHEIEWMAK